MQNSLSQAVVIRTHTQADWQLQKQGNKQVTSHKQCLLTTVAASIWQRNVLSESGYTGKLGGSISATMT